MFFFLNWVYKIISVMVAVIFFTLLERKIMSYMQNRKGPKKVGLLGLMTPMCDSMKLLFKFFGNPVSSKFYLFWLSPVLSLVLLFFVWLLFPFSKTKMSILYGYIFFLCFSSFSVYIILGSGWGSNSKYSLLGSIRGSAQSISYEVKMVFISFFPVVLGSTYNFSLILEKGYKFLWIFSLFFLWIFVIVAETNRAPLDFSEGESELVSGFNTEYGAMEFACLFLGEYGQIIFLSFLTFLIWFSLKSFIVVTLGIFLSLSFIWFRSTFVRFRYDLLMKFSWSFILPYLLVLLVYIFSI